ncbi:MAG: methyltransferase domain-containing protein [Promethearchaeota archaeon]
MNYFIILFKPIDLENQMMEYWNKRFLLEGKIWGQEPSKSAFLALKLFKENNIRSILIPGAGYGRNSKLFSDNKFKVTGIEFSKNAYELSKEYDLNTQFINGNVLDMPLNEEKYDAIYCFNVLHLFLQKNRELFLKKCFYKLKKKGFIFFVVMSEKEKSFGKGKKIEPNTFESKPGRPVHYFTKKDLNEHFKNFQIIISGIIEDKENHGEIGQHVHILRYIFARKK